MTIYNSFRTKISKYGLNQILIVAISMLILGLGLSNSLTSSVLNATLSPIDEAAHIDYSIHLASGTPPKWGDYITRATGKIVDCKSNGLPPLPPAKCSQPVPTSTQYAAGGYSYEALQPPLGYIPYAIAWNLLGLSDKSPSQQLLDLRLINWFWILMTVIEFGLFVLMMELTASVILGLVLFLGLNPLIQSSFSYVSNDSSSIALGMAGVLLYTKLTSALNRESIKHSQKYLYIGFGVILGLTKETLLAIPLSFLVFSFLMPSTTALRSLRKIQALQLIAAIISGLGYQVFLLLISPVSAKVVYHTLLSPFTSAHISLSVLETSVQNIFTVLTNLNGIFPQLFFVLVSGALISSLLISSTTIETADYFSMMLPSLGLVALLEMMANYFYLFFLGHYSFATPSRYLLPLLPLLLFVLVPVLVRNSVFVRFFLTIGFVALLFQVFVYR